MKLLRRTTQEPKPARRPKTADVLGLPEDEELDEMLFDPERDLSEADFEEMKAQMNAYRGSSWGLFCTTAMSLAVLFPKRQDELDLESAFDGMKDEMNRDRDSDWRQFSYFAKYLVILFPNRKDELGLDKEAFDGMKDEMNKRRSFLNWRQFSEIAMNLAVFAAERKDELGLNKEAFDGMKDEMNKRRGSDWRGFGETAESLVILFPNRKDGLGLDKEAFDGMKDEMNKRRWDWFNFSLMAKNLAVLSAERVEISEADGMKIIKKKKPLKRPTPLPERPQV